MGKPKMTPKKSAEIAADEAFNEACRGNNYPPSRDLALWRAVVGQALDDACGAQTDELSIVERPDAQKWLTDNGDDFEAVCLLGDLDPGAVIAKARSFRDMGWCVTRAVRAA